MKSNPVAAYLEGLPEIHTRQLEVKRVRHKPQFSMIAYKGRPKILLNAGLGTLEMRPHSGGVLFRVWLWRSANFQLEKDPQKWTSRYRAAAICLLAAQ
jgi:hypothetical protein